MLALTSRAADVQRLLCRFCHVSLVVSALVGFSPCLFGESRGVVVASQRKETGQHFVGRRLGVESKLDAQPLQFFPSPLPNAESRFNAVGAGFSLRLGDRKLVLTNVSVAPGKAASAYESSAASMGAGHDISAGAMQTVKKTATVEFLGAQQAPGVVGLNPSTTYANFFVGKDPAQWRSHVSGFGRVKYSNLYPGIDLVYHGELHGRLEYDFIVAPGADPQQVRFHVAGDKPAVIDEDGSLLLDGREGAMRLDRPVLYQNIPNGKKVIAGGFVELARNEFGFRAARYDRSKPLIIDPTINLLYSTFIGGRHEDEDYDLELDANGNTYLVGRTASEDFPVSGNALQTLRSNVGTYTYDGFVMKFDNSGNLVYSSFLGGSGNDSINHLALDAAGNAYVVGSTSSSDFPVTAGASQSQYAGGGSDGFIAEISSDGSQLIYSSYFGTTGNDGVSLIKPDGSGAYIIAGSASAAGLPTTNGVFQTQSAGQANAFFGRVSFPQSGTMTINQLTYFGGSAQSDPTGVADMTIDSAGNLYFAGQVQESTFPVTSDALVKTFTSSGGCFISSTPYSIGFLTKMSPDLSKMLYSTYFGGKVEATGNVHEQVGCAQRILSMHIDATGLIYLAGNTSESDFPVTADALRSKLNGDGGAGFDGFLSILSPDGTKLQYSTFIGGTQFEYSENMAFDSGNHIWIFGATDSSDYPVTSDALQATPGGGTDGSLTELSSDGKTILYSTYLGGSGSDNQTGAHIAIDANDTLHLGGSTSSPNFPITPTALQGVFANGGVSGFDGTDAYFTLLGSGTIGTVGPPTGGNIGDTTINVSGAGFTSGATCELTEGSTVIASVLATINAGGTAIACTFPLNGAAAGSYDVVVKNADGTSFTRKGGFTVENGGQSTIWANIVGRPKIRTGSPSTFSIVYGNSGNVDAYGVPVSIELPGTFTLDIPGAPTGMSQKSRKTSAKSTAATNVVATDLYYKDTTSGSNIIQFVVPHLAPGESISIPFQATDATDGDTWAVGVTAGNSAFNSIAEAQSGLSGLSPSTTCAPANTSLQNCLNLGAAAFVTAVSGQFTDMGQQEGFTYNTAEATTAFTQYYAAAVADAINQSTGRPTQAGSVRATNTGSKPQPDGLGVNVSCCNEITVTPTNGPGGPINITYNGLPSVTTIPAIGNNPAVKNPVIGPLVKNAINQLQDKVNNQIFNSPKNICGAAGALQGGTGTFNGPYQKDCGSCNAGIQICTNTYSCNIVTAGGGSTQLIKGLPYPVNCDPNMPKFCKKKKKGKSGLDGVIDHFTPSLISLTNPFPDASGGGDGCDDGGSGGSIDPNYKSGPSGDGSASHYVRGTTSLAYVVGFENEPKATLPAAQVVVTDQLDPGKVDLSTLTLGAISFGTNLINLPAGTSSYSTTYHLNSSLSVRIQGSLNVDTGLLKWTFTSIDPSTGLPPSDPTLGFLPPDSDGIIGQGSVIFNVMPAASLTTGTTITNMAKVVFDTNAAINTPAWLNTLDVDAPVSKVSVLPAHEITSGSSAAFAVNWSGTDKGSGISTYDVYVSDNEGAFTLWQGGVSTTTANYTGTLGHSYGFYSIATDAAGNAEVVKTTAETTTTVVPPTPLVTTTTLSASAVSIASGTSVTLTATVAPPSGTASIPTGMVSFLSGTTLLGATALDGTGKATLATTALVAGTDNLTASYPGDALFAASVSTAVSVTVGNPSVTITISPSTATISSGSSATATITVTPQFGYHSEVSFACSGLPANATCSFSPTTVTPSGAPASSTLTIATGVASSTAVRTMASSNTTNKMAERIGSGIALSLVFLPWSFLRIRRRLSGRVEALRSHTWLILFLMAGLLAGATALSGCGGSSSSHSTPKGTSTISVTATAGAATQTAAFQLTVN